MALHADNACAGTLQEYQRPIYAFGEMYQQQFDLQQQIFMKRHPEANGDLFINHSKFGLGRDSLFFWGCATTEFFELIERLEVLVQGRAIDINDEWLEAQFEYIDIFHFLMNMFLYAGVNNIAQRSFDELYDEAEKQSPAESSADNVLLMSYLHWGELSALAGRIINNLPFKTWKSYDGQIFDFSAGFGQPQEDLWLTFIRLGCVLNIDRRHFYNLYRSKKDENIRRQARGGIYEKR